MPFADYSSWDECISRNRDKRSPESYCGSIKHRTEDKMSKSNLRGLRRRLGITKAAAFALELAARVAKAGRFPDWPGLAAHGKKEGKRTYLAPGEDPPAGVQVQQGERGGRYYEGAPQRGGTPQPKPQRRPAGGRDPADEPGYGMVGYNKPARRRGGDPSDDPDADSIGGQRPQTPPAHRVEQPLGETRQPGAGFWDPKEHQYTSMKPFGDPVPASSVRVDTTSYEVSWGKKPRTTPGAPGSWLFSFGKQNAPYKMYHGSLKEAADAARRDAGKLGYYSVHVQP